MISSKVIERGREIVKVIGDGRYSRGMISSKVIEIGREIVIVIGGGRYSRGSDFLYGGRERWRDSDSNRRW